MEIIWKKHHNCGHFYKSNINKNDRDIIKNVSGGLPPGLFLPSTEPISLITNTGCRDTVFGFKYFLGGYIMELKTCFCLKGILGSCKVTHKGTLDMEVLDNNGYIIPLKTTELYFPIPQCQIFIPQRYLKE